MILVYCNKISGEANSPDTRCT